MTSERRSERELIIYTQDTYQLMHKVNVINELGWRELL